MKRFLLLFLCPLLISQGFSQSDEPCTAPALTVGTTCTLESGTNVGATNTAGVPAPGCGSYSGNDVWYAITVPATGNLTIEMADGSLTDCAMAVYSGTCASLSLVACDDDSGPGLMPLLNLTGLTPGATVWLRIWKYSGGGTGTFQVCAWDPVATGENNDCATATQICETASFDDNSSGDGIIDDLNASNRGCLATNEHQSAWYYFQIATGGTLTFTIDPDVNADDFDFAIWGPASSCPPTTTPTRCSYSALNGNTGLNNAAADLSEDALGNKWVKYMDVLASEIYILCVDNFTASNNGFLFSFGGTATISCEPIVLPVTITNFTGESTDAVNHLSWNTETEINSQTFFIERSVNGTDFTDIGAINAAGYSTQLLSYDFYDRSPWPGTNYYRLREVDYNGINTYSGVITVMSAGALVGVYPNPTHNGVISISCQEEEGENIFIVISNSYGQEIYSLQEILNGSIETRSVTLPRKGIYYVNVKSGNTIISQKVVY